MCAGVLANKLPAYLCAGGPSSGLILILAGKSILRPLGRWWVQIPAVQLPSAIIPDSVIAFLTRGRMLIFVVILLVESCRKTCPEVFDAVQAKWAASLLSCVFVPLP